MVDFNFLREKMVVEQIERRGIKNRQILEAFRRVERHRFVQQNLQESAYEDCPLYIGYGQTISQPYMVALMSEWLNLNGDERVLELGTGCGYQSAILSVLAKDVYSIERIEALLKKAALTLKTLGYTNLKLKLADGTLGWEEESPFDRIIITAACNQIPKSLIEQLAVGGRIVAPVGERSFQTLTILDKDSRGVSIQEAGGCVFVPLIGEYGYPT